ncbi:MAG TPA: response regulator [Candidatus Dormibacteraeota bacterium]|jgi:DNA-binding response OmpR family regulator
MTLGTRSGIRKRETVLIADPEPGLRLLIHEAIESPLYRVVEAADGEEAWRLIRDSKPIVVLLDVDMPGRSGLNLLSAIRADRELQGTQVIMLSASQKQSDIDAGLLAGADFYMTKPLAAHDLVARVAEAIEHQATW